MCKGLVSGWGDSSREFFWGIFCFSYVLCSSWFLLGGDPCGGPFGEGSLVFCRARGGAQRRGTLVGLMFKIFSWNVRELNNPSKRNAVRFMVSSLRNAVVCLQDTKVNHVSGSFLRSFCGSFFDKWMFIEANGASGGLLTCWSSRNFECSDTIVRLFSLTLRLRHRSSGFSFFLTNVYGPPRWEGKSEFCDELRQLKSTCEGCWVVCGDFNFTRSQAERSSKEWSRRATFMFNELIHDLALIDLPLKNLSFTWSNMQHVPALAKLDRFLVSTEWDSFFRAQASRPCLG